MDMSIINAMHSYSIYFSNTPYQMRLQVKEILEYYDEAIYPRTEMFNHAFSDKYKYFTFTKTRWIGEAECATTKSLISCEEFVQKFSISLQDTFYKSEAFIPEVGKWYWFYNGGLPVLGEFVNILGDATAKYGAYFIAPNGSCKNMAKHLGYFESCQPFTGVLPEEYLRK